MYETEKIIIYLAIGIFLFITTYYDAKYRIFSARPILWATAILILPPIIIIYYMKRKKQLKQ